MRILWEDFKEIVSRNSGTDITYWDIRLINHIQEKFREHLPEELKHSKLSIDFTDDWYITNETN